MKGRKNDIVGKKTGRLTVIKRVENKGRNAMWLCKCDCGNLTKVRRSSLNKGITKSCGCLRKDLYKKKYNKYYFEDDIAIGLDSNGKVFIVDKDKHELIKKYTWLVDDKGYAKTTLHTPPKNETLSLHGLIMGESEGFVIDHINRNPSDNRKSNLRFITHSENCMNGFEPKNNSSGVRGVSIRKDTNMWQANITVDYERIYLGQFEYKEGAIKARIEAEKKYFQNYTEFCENSTNKIDDISKRYGVN